LSVNKFQPHLLILPEDQAVKDVAIGAVESIRVKAAANLSIEKLLDGWRKLEDRLPEYDHYLGKHPEARLLAIIDLDGDRNRPDEVRTWINVSFADRIFLLSSFHEPEALQRALHQDLKLTGSLEMIGGTLVDDCPDDQSEAWAHSHLEHNKPELERFMASCRPILFDA